MNELQFIKNEALGLAVGDTDKVFCCFCDNNPKYMPSLSLTRIEEGILYNCYRASCSGHGFIGTLPSTLIEKPKTRKEFKPKPFYGLSYEFNQLDFNNLHLKYGVEPSEVLGNGIKRIRGGFLLPLFNSSGLQFGHTTKYNTKEFKAIHYLTTDTCKLHYVNTTNVATQSTIILVEDVLSAIRVHRFHQGVSLLGTHLNTDMVKDLLSTGCRHIILALDPDALDKAVQMKRNFGLFFNTFKVVSLSKDPKDLPHDRLKEELGL